MNTTEISDKTKITEEAGYSRRRFLQNAAVAVGTAQLGITGLAKAQSGAGPATAITREPNGIRPFHINIPDADLADLRRRVLATRWPERETVMDASQGVQLATVQALISYWGSDYDWRKCEAKLNSLPQFTTEIDGLDIHFIHVRSEHKNALPIIITHGWPGSMIEQLKIVGPLTDPTAYGGKAEDAFDVVIPSLPGYGFYEHNDIARRKHRDSTRESPHNGRPGRKMHD